MSAAHSRCKCLHCKELFLPNYRSAKRQRFCSKPACQKARKRASQAAWLSKPENQNYFRGQDHAARVRQWQKEHPGYWKNSKRWKERPLQDACPPQPANPQELMLEAPARTLQDLCSLQVPLLVGLISMWTHSTLQDDIAQTTRRVVAQGYDILGMVPEMNLKGPCEKTSSLSGATSESPSSVQLDRSPPGAGKLLRPV